MQNSAVKFQPLDMVRWREIVEAWNGNIETQQAYCKRLGISLNTFSYARSKLQQQTKPKNHFIPIALKSSEEKTNSYSASHSAIVIENPRGYKLHLSVSLSSEQLAKLFKISGWSHA